MQVSIGKHSYTHPATWNEMTTKQAIVCARALVEVMLRVNNSKMPEVQDNQRRTVLFRILPYLLNIPMRRWRKILKHGNHSELALMAPVSDVVFSDHTKTKAFTDLMADKRLFDVQKTAQAKQLKLKMLPTKQHLPVISWPWYSFKNYYGPVDLIYNMQIDEFKFADSLFIKAWQNPESNAINEFIAVLYRPGKPFWQAADGDKRQAFNKHTIVQRSHTFKSLPIGIKYLIMLWFKGCRTAMQMRFPYVYPETTNQKLSSTPQPMNAVIMQMAGPRFGTMDETKRVPLYDFMYALNSDLEKIAKQKQD